MRGHNHPMNTRRPANVPRSKKLHSQTSNRWRTLTHALHCTSRGVRPTVTSGYRTRSRASPWTRSQRARRLPSVRHGRHHSSEHRSGLDPLPRLYSSQRPFPCPPRTVSRRARSALTQRPSFVPWRFRSMPSPRLCAWEWRRRASAKTDNSSGSNNTRHRKPKEGRVDRLSLCAPRGS
jgi:hypothetical protein